MHNRDKYDKLPYIHIFRIIVSDEESYKSFIQYDTQSDFKTQLETLRAYIYIAYKALKLPIFFKKMLKVSSNSTGVSILGNMIGYSFNQQKSLWSPSLAQAEGVRLSLAQPEAVVVSPFAQSKSVGFSFAQPELIGIPLPCSRTTNSMTFS